MRPTSNCENVSGGAPGETTSSTHWLSGSRTIAPRVPPSRDLNAGAGRPCDVNRAVSAASSGKKNVNTRRPVVSRTAPDLS